MINDLIKRCQEEVGLTSCENCILFEENINNDFICLSYLITAYNEKYNEKFCIEEKKEY